MWSDGFKVTRLLLGLAMATKGQGQNFDGGLEAKHTKKYKHKAGRPIRGRPYIM